MPRFEVGGVALAYEEAGDGDPPILLLHGIACDRRYFAPQFDHLGGRHRTVAIDLRGHGGSDAPAQDYTVQGFAHDVAAMCSGLGLDRPVLVGHSLGGLVALEAAASARAVVMIDSPLLVERGERMHELIDRLRTDAYPDELQSYFEAFFLPGDASARRDWILSEIQAVPRHVVVSTWENGVFAFDDAAALANCQVPLHYIVAGTPTAGLVEAGELCAGLTVEAVTGTGHFAPLEAPDQVNGAIDRFIAGLG